jgi:hypothetical protein
MPSIEYHNLQAGLLIRLAETTSDSATAQRLMTMAAGHIALADEYAARSMKPLAATAVDMP